MPSRKKRRLPGEEANGGDGGRTIGGSSVADVDAVVVDAQCIDSPSSTTSFHELHATLFVTGPATVYATAGNAHCHGWRLESERREEDASTATLPSTSPSPSTPPTTSSSSSSLSVPEGVVVRVEAAPLSPGDVPLTSRSARIAVVVPQGGNNATPAVSLSPPPPSSTSSSLPPPPPSAWRAAAASIAQAAKESLSSGGGPPSVVVVGPKNSGKSSFARLLVNELLSSLKSSISTPTSSSSTSAVVAWCEADCGQPELTPPGVVSLSHLSRPLLAGGGMSGDDDAGVDFQERQRRRRRRPPWPERAHFLGALSPAADPDRTCAAVASLLEWHWQHGFVREGQGGKEAAAAGAERQQAKKRKEKAAPPPRSRPWPPLVVNTPGWVRGAGLDLLHATLRSSRPTHLVRLSTGNGEKDAPPACELVPFCCSSSPYLEVVELPALSSSSAATTAEGEAGGEPSGFASGFGGPFPAPQSNDNGGGVGGGRYSAADARNSAWLEFARQCVESAAADAEDEEEDAEGEGENGGDDGAELSSSLLPALLAAARPLSLPLSAFRLEFLDQRPSESDPGQALRVLNGSLVAMATEVETGRGLFDDNGDGDAEVRRPSPVASLALVRGVDAKRGIVHLLCPLRSREAASSGTVALQVGSASLELPPALLAGGTVEVVVGGGRRRGRGKATTTTKTEVSISASPYFSPWCLAAGGTGARAVKPRNDLARGGGGGGGAR